MDSSTPFTHLLNTHTDSDLQDSQPQQFHNFNPQHYPMNYPPPVFPNQYPPNFNPFAGPSSFQHFNSTAGSYHGGPYQGNMGQYPPGMFGSFASNGPASPVGSIFFGASGGSSSRDESSPITSASPAPRVPPMQPAPAIPVADDSESSTDDGGKKRGRTLWSEEDNIRLASAWLKNSNDPIDGNGKHRERYWKEVAAEYNKTAPKNKKRTALQCKEHWNKNIPSINKFNGFYNDVKNIYASGQSEDQLMEKVRAKWKSVMKKNRPFPLEHWWSRVKNEPKWARTYSVEEVQKRIRLNSAGAYSSSSAQDTDGASAAELLRPQGRDAAKSERKNKGKRPQSSSTFTEESMQMFNELQLRKSAAAENYESEYDPGNNSTPLAGYGHGPIHGFSRLLEIDEEIRDKEMHHKLKNDLVEHIWQRFGGNQA